MAIFIMLFLALAGLILSLSDVEIRVYFRHLHKQYIKLISMFCTIRVFIPYSYGTYHTRIRIWYNHTRMVRIIVPYEYGASRHHWCIYS